MARPVPAPAQIVTRSRRTSTARGMANNGEVAKRTLPISPERMLESAMIATVRRSMRRRRSALLGRA